MWGWGTLPVYLCSRPLLLSVHALFVECRLFDKRKTGELLSRLSSDTTSLQDVATSMVSMFFRGLIQVPQQDTQTDERKGTQTHF